jgi:hypothetical protein
MLVINLREILLPELEPELPRWLSPTMPYPPTPEYTKAFKIITGLGLGGFSLISLINAL